MLSNDNQDYAVMEYVDPKITYKICPIGVPTQLLKIRKGDPLKSIQNVLPRVSYIVTRPLGKDLLEV